MDTLAIVYTENLWSPIIDVELSLQRIFFSSFYVDQKLNVDFSRLVNAAWADGTRSQHRDRQREPGSETD